MSLKKTVAIEMTDTTFRQQSTEAETRPSQETTKPANPKTDGETAVVPPFLDYEKINGHPYLVDHFKLGDSWQEKIGGFGEEIEAIDGYLANQIKHGKIDNSVEAVKEALKKVEKLCGADKSERTTMRIEKIAAYAEFLNKTMDIDYNNFKYGNR